MKNIIKEITTILNRMIGFLLVYAIFFIVIALLIAWNIVTVQILAVLAFLLIAYVLAYFAYKIWSIKNLLSK